MRKELQKRSRARGSGSEQGAAGLGDGRVPGSPLHHVRVPHEPHGGAAAARGGHRDLGHCVKGDFRRGEKEGVTQTTQEGTPSTLNMDEVAEISGWTDEKNRTTYSPPGRVVPVKRMSVHECEA